LVSVVKAEKFVSQLSDRSRKRSDVKLPRNGLQHQGVRFRSGGTIDGERESATPPPERTPDEFITADIDRVAKLAGLARLKTANVAPDDVEVRVWYGFGLFALEGFVIKRTNNQWVALHLKADHYSSRDTKRVARVQLNAPTIGWEHCWQRLTDAGILTLPSGTEGPDPDDEGFYVETMVGGSYRNYLYHSPEYSETPNAKKMLVIGDIISDEFGLKRFHVAKPAQSSTMPNKSLDARLDSLFLN
jgi:hypothetical protein